MYDIKTRLYRTVVLLVAVIFLMVGCNSNGNDSELSSEKKENGSIASETEFPWDYPEESTEEGKIRLTSEMGNIGVAGYKKEGLDDFCLEVTAVTDDFCIFGAFIGVDEIKSYPQSGYRVIFNSENHTVSIAQNGNDDNLGSRNLSYIAGNKEIRFVVEVGNGVLRVTVLDDYGDIESWPEFELELDELKGNVCLFTEKGSAVFDARITERYSFFEKCEREYTNYVCQGYADPDVLYYDGTYYMYATSSKFAFGYEVYTSTDLIHWEDSGRCAMSKNICGYGNFWAPDVEYINGKFYMVVTSNMSISIAVADSPFGPFIGLTGHEDEYLFSGIDGNLFVDDDGRIYLYYAGINVVELSDDLTKVISDPIPLLKPEKDYEANVVEAPFVMKNNGLYYLVYSANQCTNRDYCVCYAVSSSPTGPFERYGDNPILIRSGDMYGVGHCSFVPSPDKSAMYIVYHCHESTFEMGIRNVCIDLARFSPTGSGTDRLEVYGPTHLRQEK